MAARGALLLGDTAKADAYAADVRKRCADLIASGRKLKTDHDTEIALGAAIEVTAQRLEATKGANAATDYVRGELAKIDGPVALVSRLNKRINMLAMAGTSAPELAIEDFVGNRPATLSPRSAASPCCCSCGPKGAATAARRRRRWRK